MIKLWCLAAQKKNFSLGRFNDRPAVLWKCDFPISIEKSDLAQKPSTRSLSSLLVVCSAPFHRFHHRFTREGYVALIIDKLTAMNQLSPDVQIWNPSGWTKESTKMIWPKLNTMFSAGLGHTQSHGVTVHGMRKPEKSGGSRGEVVVSPGEFPMKDLQVETWSATQNIVENIWKTWTYLKMTDLQMDFIRFIDGLCYFRGYTPKCSPWFRAMI